MELITKVKIISIKPLFTSNTVKEITRKLSLVVVEVPKMNPYGKDFSKTAQFEIDIYNNNIDKFKIIPADIGMIREVKLIVIPYKKDEGTPVIFNFIVDSIQK